VRTPDLILLDLMMPDMDGLQVCRRLRSDPESQRIPIIFLTASNEMEHLVRVLKPGRWTT
jgi:CheY-like chemotaxis protein